MIDQLEARLHLIRMARKNLIMAAGINVDRVREFIDLTRDEVADGLLGYALAIAEKPSHA